MSMHHDYPQQETGTFTLLSSQGSVLQQALACMHTHVYERLELCSRSCMCEEWYDMRAERLTG